MARSVMLLVGLCLLALSQLGGVADGARILAVLPMPARSHMISFLTVTKALAKRGHDVTVIAAFPQKENIPNHTVIPIGNVMEEMMKKQLHNFFDEKMHPLATQLMLFSIGELIVNKTLTNEACVQVLSKPNQKYDLILAELFFYQEALVGLTHKFNAPMVVLHPFGSAFWVSDTVGNPTNPSYIPSAFLELTDRMDFFQRLTNAVYTVFQKLSFELYYYPLQQGLMEKFFPGAPPMRELLTKNIALTLVNNHHSLFYPAPNSPNVIEVGGMHISHEKNPLPKSLQDYMDAAKEGVVYFSFGSNLRIESMPGEKKEAIVAALGAINMRVLMKWDGPKPKNLPANIRLEEWVPQSDLLRHPNMRLFVTHGGLLSTQESVFHGVPLVGIPIFGDQHFNMKLAVLKGFAVKLELADVTKESLLSALNEALGNPKYAQNTKKLSAIFRSQPVKPVDNGVFWIEHILAHGWDHLRPSSTELYWYQLLLLDVLAVAMVPVLLVLLCCRRLCCRGKSRRNDQPSADRLKKRN